MRDLTAAQRLIQAKVLQLENKLEKATSRMERNIPKVRETAADRAEKLTRARWQKKISVLEAEVEALRSALPDEAL